MVRGFANFFVSHMDNGNKKTQVGAGDYPIMTQRAWASELRELRI
jgi:hypothetical protein